VDNAGYKCSIASSGTTQIAGAGEGTYNSTFSATVLSILIQDKVVRQEVERLGLPEPSALGPVALSQLQAASAPASGCTGSGASVLAAFPRPIDSCCSVPAGRGRLSAHLAGTTLNPGPLGAYVARHKTKMMLACVSVIETGTKATALSLRSQILGGTNFAVLAKAHSIDSTTAAEGGVIGAFLTRTSTLRSTT